jgi:hypothetical protein
VPEGNRVPMSDPELTEGTRPQQMIARSESRPTFCLTAAVSSPTVVASRGPPMSPEDPLGFYISEGPLDRGAAAYARSACCESLYRQVFEAGSPVLLFPLPFCGPMQQ